MVKEECLLNVVQYLCSLSFELLHLSPTSAGLSSSLSYGVTENQSKHQQSPCLLYFITPQLDNVHHLVKVGQKAQMRLCCSKPAANTFFVSRAVLMLQYLVGVFVFKLKTIDLLLVTYILNELRSGIKLQRNWK